MVRMNALSKKYGIDFVYHINRRYIGNVWVAV